MTAVRHGVERLIRRRLYYPGSMTRSFAKVSLADAVGRLRPGMRVLMQPGCGDPSALVGRDLRQADRLAPLTLMGGLRLDDYPFAAAAYAGKLRFATWHMSPRLDDAAARGDVDFVPARYFDIVSLFAAGRTVGARRRARAHGAARCRAAICRLGVSAYALPAARRAPLVIAQVNPRMPRTLGKAFLHRSQIDCWVEVDEPLLAYPPTPIGDVERRIARHVAELVPDGATIQVGVGAIPQAVMEALAGTARPRRALAPGRAHAAAGRAGVITNARKRVHPGRMDIGEIMGTAALFDVGARQPRDQHGAVGRRPRSGGGRGARRLRLGQLGARGGSARAGERREPGRPAGGGDRRAVRLRARRGRARRAAGRSSRCRRPASGGLALADRARAWPRARA